MDCSTPGFLSFSISQSLLKVLSIGLVMPSNHLIFCYFLLLLVSVFPSIRVFSNKSALRIRWPKYRSFGFSLSPFNENSGLISIQYSRLISSGIDWFDLFAVQGTLKSLPQQHNLKAPILWCSTFFMVQISYPYMTTGKTTALSRQTFVNKGMSLLFNTLSTFVRAFLPKSKNLLMDT